MTGWVVFVFLVLVAGFVVGHDHGKRGGKTRLDAADLRRENAEIREEEK